MAQFKLTLLSTTMMLALAGCTTQTVQYDVSLVRVDRPIEARERYGEQEIVEVEQDAVRKYSFEDEMVSILWVPFSTQVGFTLTNKTDHSMKIIWDEAVFVGHEGQSHRVVHAGVKYADRNNSQPPSVVVRKGSLSDMVMPADNIAYSGGWRVSPLFPVSGSTPDAALEQAQTYVGKTIQVLLPLDIEGVVNEYMFTFQVNDVAAP